MLRGKLCQVLAAARLRSGRLRACAPHLTLLWGEHDLRPRAIEPIRWPVREFVLLASGGGRTTVLRRFPLERPERAAFG